MIVTVTANTTMDQAMRIPRWEPNATIRASETVHSMGGKPSDASWILGRYGIKSWAMGIAAGAVGGKITRMLEAEGVDVDFVQAEGESRMALLILDENDGSQTTVTPRTLFARPEHVAELTRRYELALNEATVVVLGGSLPPGIEPSFYTDMIAMARARDIPVVFDAGEPNLSAGLKSRPTYIKPNRREISGYVGRPVDSYADAYAAGRAIYAQYGTQSVISLGADGAVAVLADRAYRIPPIDVDVVTATGAGDGILAGITYALYKNLPIEDGLRFGVAAATAICLNLGTAYYEVEDLRRFLPLVELIPYAGE